MISEVSALNETSATGPNWEERIPDEWVETAQLGGLLYDFAQLQTTYALGLEPRAGWNQRSWTRAALRAVAPVIVADALDGYADELQEQLDATLDANLRGDDVKLLCELLRDLVTDVRGRVAELRNAGDEHPEDVGVEDAVGGQTQVEGSTTGDAK